MKTEAIVLAKMERNEKLRQDLIKVLANPVVELSAAYLIANSLFPQGGAVTTPASGSSSGWQQSLENALKSIFPPLIAFQGFSSTVESGSTVMTERNQFMIAATIIIALQQLAPALPYLAQGGSSLLQAVKP